MSEFAARQAITRMHHREVAVAAHLTTLAADLRQMATANQEDQQKAFLARREEMCSAIGLAVVAQNKPFAFSQGIAVIPVTGSLINRFGGSYGFVTGYNFIRAQVAMAGLDPDVSAIVFDMNSYGGEAAGCFECAADIPRLANGKPTLAIVDSNCYSACYALASQCDTIALTPSGGVGSVGVVAMHVDISKMLETWGVDITFVYSGDHKIDGNMFQALPDAVKADMQASIHATRQSFAELVATGRKLDVQTVLDTEARCYRAEDALSIGFVDAIATPSMAVQALLSELSGSNLQLSVAKEPVMADNEKAPGAASNSTQTAEQAASAAHEARMAERARINGIQSCEYAKGREKLASHLALSTDLSVEAASAILAAAPSEAPEKPASAGASQNHFAAAMDASKNPQVGADATGDAQTAEQTAASAASSILANYSLASGRKFDSTAKK